MRNLSFDDLQSSGDAGDFTNWTDLGTGLPALSLPTTIDDCVQSEIIQMGNIICHDFLITKNNQSSSSVTASGTITFDVGGGWDGGAGVFNGTVILSGTMTGGIDSCTVNGNLTIANSVSGLGICEAGAINGNVTITGTASTVYGPISGNLTLDSALGSDSDNFASVGGNVLMDNSGNWTNLRIGPIGGSLTLGGSSTSSYVNTSTVGNGVTVGIDLSGAGSIGNVTGDVMFTADTTSGATTWHDVSGNVDGGGHNVYIEAMGDVGGDVVSMTLTGPLVIGNVTGTVSDIDTAGFGITIASAGSIDVTNSSSVSTLNLQGNVAGDVQVDMISLVGSGTSVVSGSLGTARYGSVDSVATISGNVFVGANSSGAFGSVTADTVTGLTTVEITESGGTIYAGQATITHAVGGYAVAYNSSNLTGTFFDATAVDAGKVTITNLISANLADGVTAAGVAGNGATQKAADVAALDSTKIPSDYNYKAAIGSGSGNGTYPTTATSQATQFATDASAVTAFRPHIDKDAGTLLGVTGTMDNSDAAVGNVKLNKHVGGVIGTYNPASTNTVTVIPFPI